MAEEEKALWYVVHTYSGYENKVKSNLEMAVVNNGFQDVIQEVRIPVEEVVEVKNGKRRTVQRKLYPGYVMVKMIRTNEAWYLVRNTRGVTGFVGPGSDPIPLADNEIDMINTVRQPTSIDIAIGDEVKVLSGSLENFTVKVVDIDTVNQKIKARVVMFGREQIVDLDYDQVVRVE